MGNLLEEDRTGSELAAFFEVYGALGYGFLEHVYELAMERELRARGHQVSRQVAVRVRFKGADLATNLEVGLLLHFGPRLKFHRTVSTDMTSIRR